MAEAFVEEKFLKDIFTDSFNLKIPFYQRPYRWKADIHVKQLLLDISREYENDTKNYRVGSLIIHQNNEGDCPSKDIVDGQQRLVTLTLILLYLKDNSSPLRAFEFKDRDSCVNIKKNWEYINYFFDIRKVDETLKENLVKFIKENLSFSIITVYRLDEAFQLFDCQNSKGVPLKIADLLKAYHLRSMNNCLEFEKVKCVTEWENRISEVNNILENRLYRIRKWIANIREYNLTEETMDEFKGLDINNGISNGYLYAKPLIHQSMCNQFQIDQEIINGKWFFDYVLYYVDFEKQIGDYYRNKRHSFFWNNLTDLRIRNFYENALFYYLTKFGLNTNDSNFKAFSFQLFRYSFLHIFINRSIKEGGIMDNLVREINNSVKKTINVFSTLKKWFEPDIIYIRERYNKLPDYNLDYFNRFEKGLKGKDHKYQYRKWEEYCDNVFKDDDNEAERN